MRLRVGTELPQPLTYAGRAVALAATYCGAALLPPGSPFLQKPVTPEALVGAVQRELAASAVSHRSTLTGT